MQTNKVDNNPNFGKLYMPLRRDFFGRTDIYYANITNLAETYLKEQAKDVDIYVKPNKPSKSGFKITVGKVVKSPIKRFLGIRDFTISKKINIDDLDCDSMVDFLIKNVISTKKEFKKFETYLTKS